MWLFFYSNLFSILTKFYFSKRIYFGKTSRNLPPVDNKCHETKFNNFSTAVNISKILLSKKYHLWSFCLNNEYSLNKLLKKQSVSKTCCNKINKSV